MPKPMSVPQKSKDFKGSIKRLFNSLNTWKYFLILSLGLAMISAILALVAPNKLSSLTDTITLGIKPNISETIIEDIMNDSAIDVNDKLEFKKLLESAQNSSNQEEILKNFDELPESIYEIVKPKINMERVNTAMVFFL